jgi:transposase
VWVLEDVRCVSGSLERFLLDRGETVVRLPPKLMAGARRSGRERGKSDPIDALAIARAALREGVETLPTARLPERGLGVLIAAKLIGEIVAIDRFTSDAQLARISGCAPIPVSSGRTDRYRLDLGGNRQLNHAFHLLAFSKITHDPQTAAYIAPLRPIHQRRIARN